MTCIDLAERGGAESQAKPATGSLFVFRHLRQPGTKEIAPTGCGLASTDRESAISSRVFSILACQSSRALSSHHPTRFPELRTAVRVLLSVAGSAGIMQRLRIGGRVLETPTDAVVHECGSRSHTRREIWVGAEVFYSAHAPRPPPGVSDKKARRESQRRAPGGARATSQSK